MGDDRSALRIAWIALAASTLAAVVSVGGNLVQAGSEEQIKRADGVADEYKNFRLSLQPLVDVEDKAFGVQKGHFELGDLQTVYGDFPPVKNDAANCRAVKLEYEKSPFGFGIDLEGACADRFRDEFTADEIATLQSAASAATDLQAELVKQTQGMDSRSSGDLLSALRGLMGWHASAVTYLRNIGATTIYHDPPSQSDRDAKIKLLDETYHAYYDNAGQPTLPFKLSSWLF